MNVPTQRRTTPEARMMERIASHPKPFTPIIGNVYMEAGGRMITLATRAKITVIKGTGKEHVYMWDSGEPGSGTERRRVHHMQGAEREFVLFGSSIYNTLQYKETTS